MRGVTFLRQYLIAVQSFTRMPVTGALAQWASFSPDMLRASTVHFPGVGWLVGLVACTVFALLGLALPDSPFAPLAAAVGCTIATVLLTGGFHEDALAKLANEVMERPADGTYGALALCLALMAKVSLLAVLAAHSPTAVLMALLGAHVLSRFWPLLLMESGLVDDRIDPRELLIAVAWCIPPLAVAMFVEGPAFVIISLLVSGLALLWMRRLSGSLGATQQVCEIGFYLGAAAAPALG
jgi:adenosylcobinamide-GDP ribazoletransferase